MEKRYIGLISKLRGGKGSVANIIGELVAPKSVTVIGFSDAINACLDELGLERSRKNQQAFSTANREAFGQDLLAVAVHSRAERSEEDVVVIHGIRRPADTPILSALPNFKLVSIEAPTELRYRWMVRADERSGDAEKTYEQFLREDDAEPERLIDEIAKSADWTIRNDEDDEKLTKLRAETKRMLSELFGT